MKIYVVGFGAGNADGMSAEAKKRIEECDIIVGYTTYIDILKGYFPDKEFIETPMRRETERVRAAVELAEEGRTVAVVSSGDSGIYGMASLVYEMTEGTGVEVCVIPGITAASSGAALLGAPLSHDFAAVSLSDLLTPMELIEKRLRLAAEGDFVICIYNPASRKRRDYLKKACDIILKYRAPETVCGIARNIGRAGEEYEIMSLAELREFEADMLTTVFVGNSETRVIGGKMVTPRGYKNV